MTEIEYTKLFINGAWQSPATSDVIEVVSPIDEQRIGAVPRASQADVDAAVAAARAAFDAPDGWRTWSPERRRDALEAFAAELDKRGAETARRVTLQNGMPTQVASVFEAMFPAVLLRYYGQLMVDNPPEERRPGMFGGATIVTREPIGVVGAIVPWNVPQAITSLKLAPALAAGCTVVLKPAEETVLDAFLLAEAAEAAGLPPGIVNVVPGGRELGAYLVAHPGVDKVSFTGSTAAGRAIGRTCGELLRPVTLELGGKSAAIVLDDVDLVKRAESFFASTMLNNGQICWLSTRVLAPRERYTEIVDAITDIAASRVVGNPLDAGVHVGPLVSARQRERVERYIAIGKDEGGRMTTGGGRPAAIDKGYYIEPTVFAGFDNSATLAREEIFGPVLTVIPYDDVDAAVAMANDSDYGLGGTVWTEDPERGAAVARRVSSGTVGVNAYANDPYAPFGGVRASGLGRELGPEGLQSYQYAKSVYLDLS
jgi:aldehyde dehydrogenase (NAD+)